jgi:cobalt/nickel transport system permease protein
VKGYQVGESHLHRLDPRVKVVAVLWIIISIVLTPERAWLTYLGLWLVVAGLASLAHVGIVRLAQRGGLALPFTLAASTLLFTLPGQPLMSFLGLTVTDSGLMRFLSIILKSWLALQTAQLLTLTTPFTDLLWAFRSLRVPVMLVEIISFMYRYLFTLQDEAACLLRARAARSGIRSGQKSGGSLVWRAQVAGGMVGNLFLRSYERSERVYAAMLARGYNGKISAIKPPPLPVRDVLYGLWLVFILLLIEGASLWWA